MSHINKIFTSFLSHDILKSKYKLNKKDLSKNISEGIKSDIPIIRVIAELINGKSNQNSDKELYEIISRYLNSKDLC